jgi:hypothetical protein
MKGQVKIPETLPTPAQAKQALYTARGDVRQTRETWSRLKLRLKDAKEEQKIAAAELDDLEPDLLDPADEAAEAVTAKAHTAAWRRLQRAEKDADKVRQAASHARNEYEKACARLATAREDLEAVREGRRRP